MRVVFTWPDGQTSVLQREDSATKIEVAGLSSDAEIVVSRVEATSIIPFLIGMRVQLTDNRSNGPPINQFGRVVHLDAANEQSIGVEWEDWIGGHDCDGNAGHSGWYVFPADLVLAPVPQITSTTYPDCETPCGNCREPLGNCQGEEVEHQDSCLDDMMEVGSVFYHYICAPEEEEGTQPVTFQIVDEVR